MLFDGLDVAHHVASTEYAYHIHAPEPGPAVEVLARTLAWADAGSDLAMDLEALIELGAVWYACALPSTSTVWFTA